MFLLCSSHGQLAGANPYNLDRGPNSVREDLVRAMQQNNDVLTIGSSLLS